MIIQTYFKNVKKGDQVLLQGKQWETVSGIKKTARGDVELSLGISLHDFCDTRTKWVRYPDAPITIQRG